LGLAEFPLGTNEMMEFKSLASFGAHRMLLHTGEKIVEHEALETACQEIEKYAKAKIGEYQPRAGSFSAWEELADSTQEQRVAQGYSENDPGLRSGEMRDSIEHKVIGHEGHVGSDDDHLLWFELGTVKQPARSVLGGAAFELAPKIAKEIGVEYFAFLSGGGKRIKAR
jgi:hypothetical protein